MKTFIVNFPVLNIGGIEQYIYNMMKYCVSKGYKVIWLCWKPIQIADGYKDILPFVKQVYSKREFFGKWHHEEIPIDEEDEIVCVSFTPFDHDNILKLKKSYEGYNFKSFYIIANTKGRYYYIEEYYYGRLRKRLHQSIRTMMSEWIHNDYIRFFTNLQAESFEKKYNIKLNYKNEKILPSVIQLQEFDFDLIRKKAEREEFNIVTVSRFDFPHKNYLLGLIDAYGELKDKYPKMKLHIVGYGEGKSAVEARIDELSSFAKQDVILYGAVSSSKMPELMKKMHLNISVAGSVSCGGRNGVLSIPARNFCGNICEVYGYLPESNEMTTSTEAGRPVVNFIEEVIHMSKDEYILKCKASYDNYANRKIDPEYLFKQKNGEGENQTRFHRLLDIMWCFKEISYKLHKVWNSLRGKNG